MPKTITQQHQNIDHALLEIDALLDDPSHTTTDRLRASVATLAMMLQAHFEYEERSPMYTELPLDMPRFANQIDALLNDHVEMLVEAREIAELLEERQVDLAAIRMRGLMVRLGLHEAAEMELLQRAHTEDIAPAD